MTISPIETRYAGCRFRSRTEARWAVAFDAFGFMWEYEPEGFVLPSGAYLPDFKIISPVVEWIEIKPPIHRVIDPRWQELADATDLPLRVLYGVPGPDHEQQTFRPRRKATPRRQLAEARRTSAVLTAWGKARSARFGT